MPGSSAGPAGCAAVAPEGVRVAERRRSCHAPARRTARRDGVRIGAGRWTIAAAALGTPGLVWAAPTDAMVAEGVRLQGELEQAAARGSWAQADAVYRQLERLEDAGVPASYAAHRLGADAARQAGDIAAWRARLERAAALGETAEVRGALTDIDARFGPVRLEIDAAARGSWVLTPEEQPFEADGRAAIAFAQAALDQRRSFQGYLPAGMYSLGTGIFPVEAGGNEAFIAVGGKADSGVAAPAPAAVAVAPPSAPARGLDLGARVGLGPVRVGEPPAGASAGPQPPAGTGGLLRAAGRLGRATGTWSPVLELGVAAAQGRTAGGAGGQGFAYGVAGVGMELGLGEGAVAWGTVLGGVGRGWAAALTDASTPLSCGGVCTGEAARARLRAAGGAAGVRFGQGRVPLFVEAGVLSDGARPAGWLVFGVSTGGARG